MRAVYFDPTTIWFTCLGIRHVSIKDYRTHYKLINLHYWNLFSKQHRIYETINIKLPWRY